MTIRQRRGAVGQARPSFWGCFGGPWRNRRRPCVLLLWFFCACSRPTSVGGGADAQTSAPACHDRQKKADGTCCPSGQAYEFASDICFAVGPPECAEVIFNNPEKCAPKWCWDWQDADKKPCKAFAEGCDTAGRLCTSEEIAAGGGCPAGTFPLTEKLGDCAPAGYFPGSGVPRDWHGDLATLPPVPPLEDSIPEGVPPLTALPDVNNTFFCIDEKTKEERFCTQAEMKLCHRGPKGEMPDEKKCVYVGVPWPSVCPSGFIVDEKALVAEGQLPPCLPDPAVGALRCRMALT